RLRPASVDVTQPHSRSRSCTKYPHANRTSERLRTAEFHLPRGESGELEPGAVLRGEVAWAATAGDRQNVDWPGASGARAGVRGGEVRDDSCAAVGSKCHGIQIRFVSEKCAQLSPRGGVPQSGGAVEEAASRLTMLSAGGQQKPAVGSEL